MPLVFRQSNHVSRLSDCNGPGTGIQSFLDIAYRVSNLDESLERMNLQANCVFINHPRQRSSRPDIVGAEGAIGPITLPSRMGKQNVQQRTCIARGASNLESTVAQVFYRTGYSCNHRRVLREAFHLLGNEF